MISTKIVITYFREKYHWKLRFFEIFSQVKVSLVKNFESDLRIHENVTKWILIFNNLARSDTYHLLVVLWERQIFPVLKLCEVLQIQERLFCSISSVAWPSGRLHSLISNFNNPLRSSLEFHFHTTHNHAYIILRFENIFVKKIDWFGDGTSLVVYSVGNFLVIGPGARSPTAQSGQNHIPLHTDQAAGNFDFRNYQIRPGTLIVPL